MQKKEQNESHYHVQHYKNANFGAMNNEELLTAYSKLKSAIATLHEIAGAK